MISIFLIIILLCAVGKLSYHYVQKFSIKLEISKVNDITKVKNDRLVMLKFDTKEIANIRWEHEREFEYKGQMYDVLKKDSSKDSIIYWCYWDREETEVNEKIKLAVSEISPSGNSGPENEKRISDFLKGMYCNSLPLFLSEIYFPRFVFFNQNMRIAKFVQIFIPPPEIK